MERSECPAQRNEARSLVLLLSRDSLWPHQALLSAGFSRQEYWSGLPCPPPGGLPNFGIKPRSPVSSALQADSLLSGPPGGPYFSREGPNNNHFLTASLFSGTTFPLSLISHGGPTRPPPSLLPIQPPPPFQCPVGPLSMLFHLLFCLWACHPLIMPFAAIWVGLEGIIVSEVSLDRGQVSYDIPYIQNLKRNDTNELIYKTETDSQT